jgi:hypothetical protein
MTPVDLDHLAELERAARDAKAATDACDEGSPAVTALLAAEEDAMGNLQSALSRAAPALLAELRASRAVVEAARRCQPLVLYGFPSQGAQECHDARKALDAALAALDREVGR